MDDAGGRLEAGLPTGSGVAARPMVLASDALLPLLADALGALDVGVASVTAWSDAMAAALEEGAGGGDPALAAAEIIAVLLAPDASPADEAAARRLADDGVALLQVEGPGDPRAPARCAGFVADALARRLEEARRALRLSRGDAAALRREYADLQQRFAAAEALLHQLGAPKLVVRGEFGPGEDSVALDGGGVLRQRLPTGSSGLVAFDLWLLAAEGPGALTLTLRDLAGRSLASARLPLAGCVPLDWTRFALEVGAAGPDGDCMIELAIDGDGHADFALSRPALFDEMRAQRLPDDGAADALAKALALRVWGGLAGVRPPAGPGRAGGGLLAPSALPAPSLLHCAESAPGFDVVQHWAREDAILVHPVAAGVTIAVIEGVRSEGCDLLEAVLHNARPDGPAIRFSVAIVPEGAARRMKPWSPFVDWTTVPPGAWGVARAAASGLGARCDIMLATLPADGGEAQMAWGLFRGFRLLSRRTAS